MDLRSANPFRVSRTVAGACLLGVALCTVVTCQAAEKHTRIKKESKRADTREIEALESQWRDALVKADASSMDKLLSDDFFGISSNGIVSDKAQYLHRIAKRLNQFSSIELVDQKVRMQQTTAIVTSQARVVGQVDGRPISGVYRYTKVYGRENGTWRVLNFEATRVSGPHPDDSEMRRGMPLGPTVR